jgi:hypothetical protein
VEGVGVVMVELSSGIVSGRRQYDGVNVS